MAENSSELDVINHLLEVEKNASILIDDAMIEADKRIAEARTKYNAEYKEKYDAIVAEKDKTYHEKLDSISANHKKEIEEYKKSLENKNQNTDAFNKVLDDLLFGAN